MLIPLEVGETTTIMDPATGQPVTGRLDAIVSGKATITIIAPPDVSVCKLREQEPPITLH